MKPGTCELLSSVVDTAERALSSRSVADVDPAAVASIKEDVLVFIKSPSIDGRPLVNASTEALVNTARALALLGRHGDVLEISRGRQVGKLLLNFVRCDLAEARNRDARPVTDDRS